MILSFSFKGYGLCVCVCVLNKTKKKIKKIWNYWSPITRINQILFKKLRFSTHTHTQPLKLSQKMQYKLIYHLLSNDCAFIHLSSLLFWYTHTHIHLPFFRFTNLHFSSQLVNIYSVNLERVSFFIFFFVINAKKILQFLCRQRKTVLPSPCQCIPKS